MIKEPIVKSYVHTGIRLLVSIYKNKGCTVTHVWVHEGRELARIRTQVFQTLVEFSELPELLGSGAESSSTLIIIILLIYTSNHMVSMMQQCTELSDKIHFYSMFSIGTTIHRTLFENCITCTKKQTFQTHQNTPSHCVQRPEHYRRVSHKILIYISYHSDKPVQYKCHGGVVCSVVKWRQSVVFKTLVSLLKLTQSGWVKSTYGLNTNKYSG